MLPIPQEPEEDAEDKDGYYSQVSVLVDRGHYNTVTNGAHFHRVFNLRLISCVSISPYPEA